MLETVFHLELTKIEMYFKFRDHKQQRHCWFYKIFLFTSWFQKKSCFEMPLYAHNGAFLWYLNCFQNFQWFWWKSLLLDETWLAFTIKQMVSSIYLFAFFIILFVNLIKSHFWKCSIRFEMRNYYINDEDKFLDRYYVRSSY